MDSKLTPLHELIQSYYTKRIIERESCCSGGSCCSSPENPLLEQFAILPLEEQPASFGCGDPLTLAELQPGQIVLDLGSGTGYDCFLASNRVGSSGRVIGVDMTPQMILQATRTAQRLGLTNVEFRLGYLENLPFESDSVDVIISNCVINLTPDKPRVLGEAYRVLKPGGKLAITDVISQRELPSSLRENAEAWAACISGAITIKEWEQILSALGFQEIQISLNDPFISEPGTAILGEDDSIGITADPGHGVVSARICARKGK